MGERPAESRRRARALGAAAELRVATILETAGWTVVDRNWRGGGGELDLVVYQGKALRFVEVKFRDLGEHGALALDEVVTHSKRSRLRSAARAWLNQRNDDWPDIAFLVVLAAEDGTATWTDDAF